MRSAQHVIVCNERLLPRYGVDRLLIRLAAGLCERRFRISFVCMRCDRTALESISPDVHVLAHLIDLDLYEADTSAMSWISENWSRLTNCEPAILISGGWPFFSSAAFCAERGIPAIFIDAGAVPHDGMSEYEAHIQRELRRIRTRALPRFSQVWPISDFIRDTQTVPERGTTAGVHTVLLGADHLDQPMFGPASDSDTDERALRRVRAILAAGCKPIIALGRFEPGNYKNSEAVFEIFHRILQREPRSRLLMLAGADEIQPPDIIWHAVEPLDFVSDLVLDEIMGLSVLGLSVSLWEGFNLPLAEMQWCGRPVLAFNIGAHPEVVVDPWLLCATPAEMADKAIRLLREGLPDHIASGLPFERFRSRFRWDDTVARWASLIERAAVASPVGRSQARMVVIDCSCAAHDPANPGVIRVVRRLCQALQREGDIVLLFVRWDLRIGRYRFLTLPEQGFLASYSGPEDGTDFLFNDSALGANWAVERTLILLPGSEQPLLFLPEVILDGQFPERMAWARANGLAVAALLYDLIPVTHMPLCAADVVGQFPEYLETLACVDALWAISGESLHQFEHYACRRGLPLPQERNAIWLPGQFAAEPRTICGDTPAVSENGNTILCVSSIEPRKNHSVLIQAFRSLLARRPDLDVRLVLVGHRFGGADDLARWLETVESEEPRIVWTRLLSDAALAKIYREAVFTVYPSLVEGFGLPIMESLWMGRPCICHREGVTAEIAQPGGCLMIDMSDIEAVAKSLERLLTDCDLRRQLEIEASARPISDWQDYASKIANRLRSVCISPERSPAPNLDTQHPLAMRISIKAAAAAMRGSPAQHVKVLDIAVQQA